MPYNRRPLNPLTPFVNQVVVESNAVNENFNILAQAFVDDNPETHKVKNALNSDNADTVDGFHASLIPAPNVIPVADEYGKLDIGWIGYMFNSVMVINPSPNTIYQETQPCLIMVVSQDLYGLEISPNGTTWYGRFGQEHYYSTLEGGTITFYVPKNWYWRFSAIDDSTNSGFSSNYWLKFVFNF